MLVTSIVLHRICCVVMPVRENIVDKGFTNEIFFSPGKIPDVIVIV